MSLLHPHQDAQPSMLPLDEWPEQPVFASLDLGTNNCRMMIARLEGERVRVLDEFSRAVCLGEGLSKREELQEDAMQRTMEALQECALRIKTHHVTESRLIATEACRKATNGQHFLKRIKKETGLDLKILSHKDEAVLAFFGCAPLLDEQTDYGVMLDIGGGSTEILLVNIQQPLEPKISGWQSFPFGVMTLSEQEQADDMNASRFNALVDELIPGFAAFAEEHHLLELSQNYRMQMVGCSGTVTTLGCIHRQLDRFDRQQIDGLTLDQQQIRSAIQTIRRMSSAQRAQHPCIGADRAPYILAGSAILTAAVQALNMPQITVTGRGVREGIIFSIVKKYLHRDDQSHA